MPKHDKVWSFWLGHGDSTQHFFKHNIASLDSSPCQKPDFGIVNARIWKDLSLRHSLTSEVLLSHQSFHLLTKHCECYKMTPISQIFHRSALLTEVKIKRVQNFQFLRTITKPTQLFTVLRKHLRKISRKSNHNFFRNPAGRERNKLSQSQNILAMPMEKSKCKTRAHTDYMRWANWFTISV